VSVSMSQQQVDFVTSNGRGASLSEKLRSVLDVAMRNEERIAVYDFLAHGTEPVSVEEGAVLVYKRTDDGWAEAEVLPFPAPTRKTPKDYVRAALRAGWRVQVVEEAGRGFCAVWAVQPRDTCKQCLEQVAARAATAICEGGPCGRN